MSDYLAFIKQQKIANRSEHTIAGYQRDLSSFMLFYVGDYLGQEIDEKTAKNYHTPQGGIKAWWFLEDFKAWNDITEDAIKSYVSFRMQQHISARTIARQLSAIRTLFQFLITENLAQHNPAKSVKAPKQPKPLPKSLDVDLTRQLLEQPLETWQDVRDQAIFELLYSAGLRVSELASVNLSPSLDQLAAGWVRVVGKGKKERDAPVGSKAKAAIQQWLIIRNDYANADETALFVNRFGKRLSVRTIQKQLDTRTQKAGLPTKMSPHRLRHACATHVLESSGDLRAVQEMLGHANLSTTQIYTKLDLQHLANVYDGAHPRAKRPQGAKTKRTPINPTTTNKEE